MKNRNETDTLNELILVEEMKHSRALSALKYQFDVAYESVKPINLVKNLVHDVAASPDIKNDMASNIIGLVTGFISKKLVLGNNPKNGIFKKLLGTIIQFTIGNKVAKHTEDIKFVATVLLNNILKKR